MSTPSIAALAARLVHHAQHSDAFGPTNEGADLRLAAAVLLEFEVMLERSLNNLGDAVTMLKAQAPA